MNPKLEELKKAIFEGKLFIYPTDTVYGLGCNAMNKDSVEKLKEIKARDKEKPLSVIAPSLNWIKEHCIFDKGLEKYLPGPYTLILEKQVSGFLPWVSNTSTLGIRIPKSDFTRLIKEAGVPFITTSVNLAGESPLLRLAELDEKIKEKVDFIVQAAEESKMTGKPSSLVINGEIRERK